MKAFRVDLKAWLGLVLPSQKCPIVVWENWGWFSGDFTLWATPTSSSSLLWTTIVVHDIYIFAIPLNKCTVGDRIILIVLLWFKYCALLQLVSVLFYRSTIVPTLVENSWFFNILVCHFFKNNNIDWLMIPRIPHHKVTTFCTPQLYLRVKYPLQFFCLPCPPCYTAVQIKNCSKSMSVITMYAENTIVPCALVLIWNWSIHCPSLSAILNS